MQRKNSSSASPYSIDETILASIHARRIRPGARLGEEGMASLFGVSRTVVREAMMRLEARHIVEVRPRRGWYVVEPSAEEARRVYEARRALESGVMRIMPPLDDTGRQKIAAHLDEERAALADGDHPRLVLLMGDFHIRLVELVGNPVIAEILRDLTARTILISMLYQSSDHAEQSHRGHCRIAEALERGDHEAAATLSIQHLDDVEAGLNLDIAADPFSDLRRTLALEDAPVPVQLTSPPDGKQHSSQKKEGTDP